MSKFVSLFALSMLLVAGFVYTARPSISQASASQVSAESAAGCACGQCESGCGCCIDDVCTCSSCECDLCALSATSEPSVLKAACCASGKCSALTGKTALAAATSGCVCEVCDGGCDGCSGDECVCTSCVCALGD